MGPGLAALEGRMLILKYFLVVAAVLPVGLLALDAPLRPSGSTAQPAVIHSATSASLPTVAPKAEPANTDPVVESSPVTPPPSAKSAASSRRSHRSTHANRRSHW